MITDLEGLLEQVASDLFGPFGRAYQQTALRQ
jgi:hypothetical protein